MRDILIKLFYQHKGKIIGAVGGFFISWLIVTLGLFKTIFIIAFIIAGGYIGGRFDLDDGFTELIERFIPPNER